MILPLPKLVVTHNSGRWTPYVPETPANTAPNRSAHPRDSFRQLCFERPMPRGSVKLMRVSGHFLRNPEDRRCPAARLVEHVQLMGREDQSPRCNNSARLECSKALPAMLPLPAGEGRGEGERALEIADGGPLPIGSRTPGPDGRSLPTFSPFAIRHLESSYASNNGSPYAVEVGSCAALHWR